MGQLILFHRQQLVRSFLLDLARNFRLTAYGIDRYQRPVQTGHLEQRRNGGDLVGLGLNAKLAKHQSVGARPGADDMGRHRPVGAVVRSPLRLAVNGHRFCPGHLHCHRSYPGDETGFDTLGINFRECVREGIVGGNAVGQSRKSTEPVKVRLTEIHHIRPVIRVTNNCAQGDYKNVDELVTPVFRRVSRIIELSKLTSFGKRPELRTVIGRSINSRPGSVTKS